MNVILCFFLCTQDAYSIYLPKSLDLVKILYLKERTKFSEVHIKFAYFMWSLIK